MFKYDDEWNWKLRAAFLFILAHMVILILPFFSIIFLLMEILGEGSSQGKRGQPIDHFQAFTEGSMLILLIGIFFSEMITMFAKPFSTLVLSEVILLGTFYFTSYNCDGPAANHVPLIIIVTCTFIKICCAYFSTPMENAKKTLLKRGPGKIV